MFLYIINIIYERCSWIIQRDSNNFPVKFPFINHGQSSQGLDLENFTNLSPSFTNLNNINYKRRQQFYKIEVLLNWNKQMLESARKGKYQNRTYVDIPGSLSPNAPSTSAFAKDGSSHVCGSNP